MREINICREKQIISQNREARDLPAERKYSGKKISIAEYRGWKYSMLYLSLVWNRSSFSSCHRALVTWCTPLFSFGVFPLSFFFVLHRIATYSTLISSFLRIATMTNLNMTKMDTSILQRTGTYVLNHGSKGIFYWRDLRAALLSALVGAFLSTHTPLSGPILLSLP